MQYELVPAKNGEVRSVSVKVTSGLHGLLPSL